MSQYAHLSNPDPEWAQFVAMLPAEPETRPVLEDRRRAVSQMARTQNELWEPPYPKSGLKVAEISIPVQGESIAVRTYIPEIETGESLETRFPLLVWFHGGGFVLGDLGLDDATLRLLCVKQRVSCVNVDYRLAPEHPFPIPLDDCYLATQWAAANASLLLADLKKGFIVGGTSAGGNLAAVVALKSRDDSSFETKITGQILQIPYLCPFPAYPEKWKGDLLSLDQNKDAPLLGKRTIQLILEIYAPPDLTSPDIAPLLASSHVNLPTAYLQICGLDPLRDEGFLYEKVLRESGVQTKYDIYPGQPHGFSALAPNMTQSRKWREDLQNGVEWLLQVK